jgi:hypothetical protein
LVVFPLLDLRREIAGLLALAFVILLCLAMTVCYQVY